jgi:hypothetical protein
MSIIHDALKKVQQGLSPKSDKTPTAPTTSKPPSPDYIYATPTDPAGRYDQQPIEHLPSRQNKAKSVLAFLCALAITLGAFVFLYKQLCSSLPGFKSWTELSFNKLIHQKEQFDSKNKTFENFKPLAKITVNPPKPPAPPSPTNPSSPTEMPAAANMIKPGLPSTLNIHGVMSNGSNNLVLINDQVYQEGDEVDGIKIVKINLNTITVINNGKKELIRVKN